MQKYQLIALTGKSGSGKDSILNASTKDLSIFHRVVACTTRPIRDNETDGKEYHFLSIEEFTLKVLNGDMIEATEFNDWFYGTTIDALDPYKINIGIFSPSAIVALQENQNIDLYIVYVHADDRERLMRNLRREQNPNCAEICRRYFADEKDFAEIDYVPNYTHNNTCSSKLHIRSWLPDEDLAEMIQKIYAQVDKGNMGQ